MEVREFKSRCQGVHRGPSVIFRVCPRFDKWLELRSHLHVPTETPPALCHSKAGWPEQSDKRMVKGLGMGQPPGPLQTMWGCLTLPGSGSGKARAGNAGWDPWGCGESLVWGWELAGSPS